MAGKSATRVLAAAEFDPALEAYIMAAGALLALVTGIGIFFLPIWLLGAGAWFARETRARLACELTDRILYIRKGIFFRSERHIPLDRIQDIAILQGPLMRFFGIHLLKVETAGQSVQAGRSEGTVLGIVHVEAFRDRILEERDRVVAAQNERSGLSPQEPPSPSDDSLLREIRDAVLRIEAQLAGRR